MSSPSISSEPLDSKSSGLRLSENDEIDGNEPAERFDSRKADHIRLSLLDEMEAFGQTGLNDVTLIHEAFPEIDLKDVSVEHRLFGKHLVSPLFISSMTAGHGGSVDLNLTMARVCEKRNWAMGVGSQRKQLSDKDADLEWSKIRKACPKVRFFGNIGLAQLIRSPTHEIRRLAETLEATAMIVHTNPLQECMQPEGTPQFAGGLDALRRLTNEIGLPVIVKETGCGFSAKTLRALNGIGLAAVDVSGLGGTHWGRIEGGRSADASPLKAAANTFRNWGVSTVQSLKMATATSTDYEAWASGGVRSGLDAAKLLAMGAKMVGFAKPIIEAALKGEQALDERMETFELELKIALFCTGSRNLSELREKGSWEAK